MATKRIDGVDASHVKPELVKAALEEVGLDSKGPVTELIPQLMAYYRGQYTEEDWFKCDVCGGLSVEEDPACPFCGEAAIDEDDSAPDTEPEPEPELVQTTVNKNKSKKAKSKKDKPSAPDKSHRGEAAKAARAETTPTVNRPATSTALIVPPLEEETRLAREKFTSKDLKKKEAVVEKYRKGFAENAWHLGHAIADIHDTDSWRVADDAKGRPYKNFRVYSQEVLGITARWAYDLMMIAKASDMKTAKELGTTKLRAILQAPEGVRSDLIEEAKAGLSREALQKKIKEAKAKSNPPADPIPPEKRPFTAVVKPGWKSAPMYKSKGRKAGDDDVRAARLDDEPEFTYECENGVVLTVKVVVKDGKIRGKLKFEKS